MRRSLNIETSDRLSHVRDVALRLFSSEGYHAVSLRTLAANVGLSSGSLYTHIDSKQELLYAIVEKAARSKNDAIKRSISSCTCRTQELAAFIRATLNHATKERASLLLASREYGALSKWHQQQIRLIQQEMDSTLMVALRNQSTGLVVTEATLKLMTLAINNILNGYLHLPESIFTTNKALKIYTAMALAAMKEINE
jgi:TetR/AcrR family transcriptional regulator, cholesterol catabolism regulator